MRAYSDIYLSDAQNTLGELLDMAINSLNIDGDIFFKMFINSGIAERISSGNPKYIAGLSSIELLNIIIRKTNLQISNYQVTLSTVKSAEYWVGWSLGYFQWYCGKNFSKIHQAISIVNIIQIYPSYHQADISKLTLWAQEKYDTYYNISSLGRIRKAAGYSQAKLANTSEVSLRSIQMYEQQHKDINKAQVSTLQKIALTLGCNIQDLLD